MLHLSIIKTQFWCFFRNGRFLEGGGLKRNLIRPDVYCLVRDDELVVLIEEQVVVEIDD